MAEVGILGLCLVPFAVGELWPSTCHKASYVCAQDCRANLNLCSQVLSVKLNSFSFYF